MMTGKLTVIQWFPAKSWQAPQCIDPQHIAPHNQAIFFNARLTLREYGQARIRVVRKGE
jgi:hypothetical protein